MKIKTASYNDGGSTYNAAAEETWWTNFNIAHRMNAPAECWITLADPTGSLMQKYNVDANDVYVGPGRVYIKNDAETATYYDGRIMKATHYRENGGQLVLYCQDWLSQLDEENITYDFRETLQSGERYGKIEPVKPGIAANTARPAYSGGANSNWIQTGTGSHAVDEWNAVDGWNGHYFVFLAGMSGTVTSTVGPYTETVTAAGGIGTDAYDTDLGSLWVDDANAHLTSDNDEDWTVEYSFYSWINAAGTDYHSSTESVEVIAKLYFKDVGSECTVSVYDGAADVEIGRIDGEDTGARRTFSWNVPGDKLDSVVDASGIIKVKFSVEYNTVLTDLNIYQLLVRTTAVTTQEDSAYAITDTSTFSIETEEDTTLAGTGCWTDQPYAVVKPIYKHIDTGESGTLVTGYDPLVTPLVTLTAAANVEHTSGITVRRYEEYTPLGILNDVRSADKAVFWIPLGTTALTWKSTFNDDAPTALADSDVLRWTRGMYDYTPMRNEYHLYGPRTNDTQLTYNTEDASGGDPGADSKSTFGVTRSGVIKNTGTNTEYEIVQLGAALVEREEDVLLTLNAVLPGLSTTYVLGGEVSVTSTPLSQSAVKYIITRWDYDSEAHTTTIQLYPRSASTKGLIDVDAQFGDDIRRSMRQQQQILADFPVLEVVE